MARSREDIQAEITELERLAKKRRGKPGYAENVQAIETRLAECRTELENV